MPSDSSLIISNLSLRAVIISLWISSISDQLDSVKTSSISIRSRISSFDLYLKGLIELSTVEFLINLFGELDLSLITKASLDFLLSLDCYICLFLRLSNTTLLSSSILSSFILLFWCLISSFSDNFSDKEDKDCFLLIWLYFLFLAIEIIYRHILYQLVIYILLYNLVLKIC